MMYTDGQSFSDSDDEDDLLKASTWSSRYFQESEPAKIFKTEKKRSFSTQK